MAASNMAASNIHLFNKARYSDLIVRCCEKEWRLHRNIVCTRSKFFDDACDDSSEIITLDDTDTNTVERMLTYFYRLDYADILVNRSRSRSILSTTSGSSTPRQATTPSCTTETGLVTLPPELPHEDSVSTTLLANALVYAMADKYDVPGLKDLARDKFDSQAFLQWPIPNFATIVRGIHESTPATDAGLRIIINKICALHIDEVAANVGLLEVAMEYSELGLGMLMEVMKSRPVDKKTFDAERNRAEDAFKALDTMTSERDQLIKDVSASHNTLNATQMKLFESEETRQSTRDTLEKTQADLAKCQDQLQRMQVKVATAESSLDGMRETTRGLQLAQQREQYRANQIQSDVNGLLMEEKTALFANNHGVMSAKTVMQAVNAIQDGGCRNCHRPLSWME